MYTCFKSKKISNIICMLVSNLKKSNTYCIHTSINKKRRKTNISSFFINIIYLFYYKPNLDLTSSVMLIAEGFTYTIGDCIVETSKI